MEDKERKPGRFQTVYQALNKTLNGWNTGTYTTNVKVGNSSNTYNYGKDVVLKTTDKAEYDQAKLQAKQDKYLANKWYTGNVQTNISTLNNMNLVDLLYRDVELMSARPEISAALDIYMEETCLWKGTKIKLLNGETYTIEELFNKKYNNFWVYNTNEKGMCTPTLIEKVIYKGKKETYKLTLDDNTEIICTPEHKWFKSDCTWIETKDLINGDSLMSIYDNLNYLGYEQIKSSVEKQKKLTHRVIAENILREEKLKLSKNNNGENYQKIVIHHKSFNKLNNDPSQLEYMYWKDHQNLHLSYNSSRWENEEFANKMRKLFSKNLNNIWNTKYNEFKENILKGKKEWLRGLTQKEKDRIYGKKGEKNGMYGVSRYGKENPNYNPNIKHIEDINEEEYINEILKCNINYVDVLSNKFHLTKSVIVDYNNIICKKYNIQKINQLKWVLYEPLTIPYIKDYLRNNNPTLTQYCKKHNISEYELTYVFKKNGFKTFEEFKKGLYNHKVIKIEKQGIEDVYDLFNSSCNSSFAVKCNNGHIISHNCTIGKDGNLINIYSKSPRIKSILEDLFINRLSIHITLPTICRTMCKYGNGFQHLNINSKNGIVAWRELPTVEIKRFEIQYPYGFVTQNMEQQSGDDLSPHFEWMGAGVQMPFRQWEISHFRLLNDSFYKPYGCSLLNGARRHWRLLSLMEDAMLIYRLEKAFERRVFKIDVGAIDPVDVPAFIQEIANNFKRSSVVDPLTGQIDLRKNILAVDQDIFIPVRGGNQGTTIESLAAGNNLDKIEDLQYIHLQMLSALRIPKPFLGFNEEKGGGKNLSTLDIRFSRVVNRIQQALIMEMNKIAIIHLYLLGFEDDLNNFTITMNNPSTQAEILRIEEMQKKILLMKDALSDSGNGLPIMSYRYALKTIMKFSDEEISEMLNDIRLEKALSAELAFTSQIIQRTGIFDKIDKLYGAPNAQYKGIENAGTEGIEGANIGGGGGGGMMMGGDMGDEGGGLGEGDFEGGDMGQDMQGQTESAPLGERKINLDKVSKLLTERMEVIQKSIQNGIYTKQDTYTDLYVKRLKENKEEKIENKLTQNVETFDKNFFLNEEYNKLEEGLNQYLKD